ncbi:serine hydrolase domain-containing protein [Roseisolibacter sp. H3M3-2]|uniref:serine hydrolase domain-containing protein n=1 Tax=Roseisolibacter sp. H3M3-2 TaxID=3031323 RepID=UPI0023DC60C0|nr:serine hydrolase domain-containing protein [Roseisolibacter sp. H3M3-2]MDF1502780.1 serine hydrolase [Roseisolibacter sp. H3M3-2]
MRLLPLPSLLLAASLGAPALPAQSAADSSSPDARAARIAADLRPAVRVRGRPIVRSTIEARMREVGVPAVSVAVVDGGRIAWARAYGVADVAAGRAATPTTRFQAASISKPVASTAALQLVAEGKLALDDDVNARLRSWQVPASPAAGGRPVTLRQLLSHTAGLTVHGFPGYASGTAVPTVAQILNGEAPANTRPVRVDTAPGGIWRYSGGGMTVMQLLLSDVTGKPFDTLMQERVLGPAGMTHSTYAQPLPTALADEAATGYRRGGAPIAGRYHTYPEQAAAGLWTTPTDLARWVIAIQNAHAGAPGAILPRATAEAMLTAGKGNWGLGPALEGEGDARRFSHGGSNEGFRAMTFGYLTGGRGLAVMTNSDLGATVASELIAAVAREYGWPGYAQREIVPVPVAPAILDSLAGRYADPAGRAFVASRDGEDLRVVAPGGQRYQLIPTGRDAFAFAHDGGPMRIERDAAGAVAALVVDRQRYPRQP